MEDFNTASLTVVLIYRVLFAAGIAATFFCAGLINIIRQNRSTARVPVELMLSTVFCCGFTGLAWLYMPTVA